MKKVLFLSDTQDGQLAKTALETLTAAVQLSKELNGELIVGLFGESIDKAVSVVAGCLPAKVYSVTGKDFEQSRYSTDSAAMETIARAAGADFILAPVCSRISRTLPGVTFRINARIDTHVSAVKVEAGSVSISRWYYRQRMEADQKRNSSAWVLTIDGGNYPSWAGPTGSVQVEELSVSDISHLTRTRFAGYSVPGTSEQTIRPDAELLFVAGAGWTKKQGDGQPHVDQAAELILGFLRGSGASLGGSKSIVDLSGEGQAVLPFMTHLNQIGQTGASPRHPKGLATCCHGEEPHVIGWRFVKERRAINLNPNCGWAQGKADVIYVADAFEVMRKVNALLG